MFNARYSRKSFSIIAVKFCHAVAAVTAGNMAVLTWTLIIVICGLVYYYYKKKLNYFEELGIPYVPGWILFGNMHGNSNGIRHVTAILRDIYNYHPKAKYFGAFDFGPRPVVVLRDIELIKSVAIKNSDKFPDHLPLIDQDMDPLFGANLINMTGDRWREVRNILTPTFTSSKLKAMFHLMVECAVNFVNYIESLPDEERKSVATKELFTKTTNDVIATCAFGISVDSYKHPNNDFYVLGKKATNLEGIQGLKFFVFRSFPWLVKIFRLRLVTPDVASFFTNIVSTTIQTRDEKGISRPDMIQQMMDARDKETRHCKFDLTMMTAQAFSFFFGGFDTTSTHMCVMAHELAINPDVQKRLQNEIDEVMKATDDHPTYETINGMQYLDAVFNETLRRHSQAPFLDRLCIADFELPPALPGFKPFTLKPGMNIWIPASAIHMDPIYFDEPKRFNPDRYYQKKVTVNDAYNLGFGIGSRSCIGNRFATMEVKILFVFLLSKFNLMPNEKTCSPLEYSKKSFALTPEGGFSLAIEPRS